MDGASTSTATLPAQHRIAQQDRRRTWILEAIAPAPPRPRALGSLLFSPPESWNCQVDRPRPAVHRGPGRPSYVLADELRVSEAVRHV